VATVISKELADEAAAPRAPHRRRSVPVWRWVILLLTGVYFLIPLYAALRFAGIASFGKVVHQTGFSDALILSLKLALMTTVLTLALMVPTTIYVHLRLPGLRRLLESITILPIVIPPVVLIVGVLEVAPGYLKSTPYLLGLVYVILAMPFAYRSLDAGLRSLELRTLVDAASSLGACAPRCCPPRCSRSRSSSASTPWPASTCTRRSRYGSWPSTRPAGRCPPPPRCWHCS